MLTGLPEDSPLLGQEVFGPVALVVPFDGEPDAVRILDGGVCGRGGVVHTADVERGVRFARRTGGGTFHISASTARDGPPSADGGPEVPVAERLPGEAAVDAFTTWRWVSIQHGRTAFPF